jgi:intraflagellar transport protein 52
MGSTDMFNDDYLEKEENAKFFDFLLKYFFTKEVEFDKKKDA